MINYEDNIKALCLNIADVEPEVKYIAGKIVNYNVSHIEYIVDDKCQIISTTCDFCFDVRNEDLRLKKSTK